jgi:hypothetical protein
LGNRWWAEYALPFPAQNAPKMASAASSIDHNLPKQRIRPDLKPASGKRPVVNQQQHKANTESRRQDEQVHGHRVRPLDVHDGDGHKHERRKNENDNPLHGQHRSLAEQNAIPSYVESLLDCNHCALLRDLLTGIFRLCVPKTLPGLMM